MHQYIAKDTAETQGKQSLKMIWRFFSKKQFWRKWSGNLDWLRQVWSFRFLSSVFSEQRFGVSHASGMNGKRWILIYWENSNFGSGVGCVVSAKQWEWAAKWKCERVFVSDGGSTLTKMWRVSVEVNASKYF